MIKKLFLLFLAFLFISVNVSAFTISYDGIVEEYTGRTVTLYVNGAEVFGDMPAIILNSRTLVPARAVFEALGAEVNWFEEVRMVTVSEGETMVSMTVGSDEAFVNDNRHILDCPARIVNDRLMIPVRFAAEALGCEVLWEEKTASVFINRKKLSAEVTGFDATLENGIMKVCVELTEAPQGILDFTLDYGSPRIVVDIEGARVGDGFSDKTFSGLEVKSVRLGQYQTDPFITRVVLDMYQTGKYEVSAEDNKVLITTSCNEYIPEPVEPPPFEQTITNDLPQLSENAKDMLVVLDAGHGGVDVGAIGRENGIDILYEKDVNLSVALYANSYLTEMGVKTYMMRSSDVEVSLYDRPGIANDLGASLYLSIHSNSFESETANGTTVLYYAGGEKEEGFSGKDFAELVQKEIVEALGTYDRGLMDGTEMYVIRKTNMPSIIAEMAFISNPGDREKLGNDECRRTVGKALARAVINALNKMSQQ